MDSIKSLVSVGSQFGLFRITPDALRGAAKFLGTAGTDPLEYTLDLDTTLRNLFGLLMLCPRRGRRRSWSKVDWSNCAEKRRRR